MHEWLLFRLVFFIVMVGAFVAVALATEMWKRRRARRVVRHWLQRFVAVAPTP